MTTTTDREGRRMVFVTNGHDVTYRLFSAIAAQGGGWVEIDFDSPSAYRSRQRALNRLEDARDIEIQRYWSFNDARFCYEARPLLPDVAPAGSTANAVIIVADR